MTVVESHRRSDLSPEFEQLFASQRTSVYDICFQVLQDKDDAYIAALNFWRRIFSRMPEFGLPRDSSLFMRLVIRELVEFLQTERAGGEEPLDVPAKDPDWARLKVEEITEKHRAMRMRFLMKQLLPMQRVALVLKFYMNYSMSEVARILACSVNTARMHVRCGLNAAAGAATEWEAI